MNCSLLVNPSHTDESGEGQNMAIYIYIHIYIYIYIYILLSIWTDELFSTPKITFLPQTKFVIEKSERESNPIPYPE